MNVDTLILLLSLLSITFCLQENEDESAIDIRFYEGGVSLSKETVIVNPDTSEVVIENPGVFSVSGKSDEGNIIISSSSVTLNLVNLKLSSARKSPIIILKDSKDIHINILANTVIKDLEIEKTTEGGCTAIQIKSNSVVYIKNDDVLTLIGECRNAIKGGYKSSVIFEKSDGEYIIQSTKTAIDVEDQLEFNGNIFKINSEKDAIKSLPDDDDNDSLGKIVVNNGIFEIECENDGFTAKNNITIVNGKFNIITGGGYDNENFDEEESAKGFKLTNNVTGSEIKIYSGEFDLNCADDGFRSLRDITILSGVFNIKSKDDGICAKINLVLGKKGAPNDDLKITILNSYEALEGMSVTIYSGKISCTADDDGINASVPSKEPERPRNHTHRNGTRWNRTDWGNFNWTNFDPFNRNESNTNWTDFNWTNFNPWGRRNNSNPFDMGDDWRQRMGIIPNDSVIVRIYGGEINLYTNSDGIDANGHIYIHGGRINIFSEGTGPNEPIDHDGNFTLFNSEILGVGTGGLEQVHKGVKKGNQMYAYYSGNIQKDKILEIIDDKNNYVNGGKITKDINYIFYTSSKLNEQYTFYLIDEEKNERNKLNFTYGTPKDDKDDEDKQYLEDKENKETQEKTDDKENARENSSKNLQITFLSVFIILLFL